MSSPERSRTATLDTRHDCGVQRQRRRSICTKGIAPIPLTRAPLSLVARIVSSGTEKRDGPHRPALNFSATSAASALPRTSFATMRPSRSSRKLAGNAVTL